MSRRRAQGRAARARRRGGRARRGRRRGGRGGRGGRPRRPDGRRRAPTPEVAHGGRGRRRRGDGRRREGRRRRGRGRRGAEAPARAQGARGRGRRRRRRGGRRRGGRGRRGGRAEPAPRPPRRRQPAPARRRDRRAPAPAGVSVRAQAKYVRTSARKARLVCDHIRGKDVAEARAILAFTPRAAAKDWAKLLESAVANAEHNHELVGEDLRDRRRLRRRGPDAQALPPARDGPRDADPQAHLAPYHHAHPEGALEHGAEGPSRSHARGLHPRLEVELVQRAPLLGLPDRGRAHPRPHHEQAGARRPVGHHDPQGRRRGGGQHPHRPARAS